MNIIIEAAKFTSIVISLLGMFIAGIFFERYDLKKERSIAVMVYLIMGASFVAAVLGTHLSGNL